MIDGHSLGGLGEEMYYGGNAPFTPYIIHFLQTYDEIGAASKWMKSHSFYQSLLQLRVKLRWLHLRDHCPYHLLHMAASMILSLALYDAIISIFMRSMVGREAHWMDVSLGRENLHIFCSTCSKGSVGDDMVTTTKHFSLYEVSHRIEWTI